MRALVKITTLCFVLLFGAACSELEALQELEKPGNDFTRVLAREYEGFSDSEAKQYDWYDSEHFAKKGHKALRGYDVPPEHPKDWSIPKENRQELEWEHHKLVNTLTQEAKARFPQFSARTQVLYDCWLEQQEENWQENDIAACKMDYLQAMADLEKKLRPPEVVPTPQFPEPVPEQYTIYFDFDKASINFDAKQVLSTVTAILKDISNYTIKLEGHADRSGSDKYNQALSEKRVVSVRNALKENGIDANKITSLAYGERKPKIPTKDGVKSRLNRRVEIVIKTAE